MEKLLSEQHCRPYTAAEAGAAHREACARLHEVPHWVEDTESRQIERYFKFTDFNATMQFVNAVANIALQQDHHPELHVTFGGCRVIYSTHSTNSLTLNDVICAAKIDRLYAVSAA